MRIKIHNHSLEITRLVLKVGTALVTTDSVIDNRKINRIAKYIARLRQSGIEVILVTSGAVGAGYKELGLSAPPVKLRQKQAAAAVGQVKLMSLYTKHLNKLGHKVSQILLTADEIKKRKSYLNVLSTLEELLIKGVVPIINENDSVATEELKLGDNDTLAALVTGMSGAQLLIILSNIDGLYRDRRDQSTLIRVVEKVTDTIKKYAKGKGGPAATGGMETKLKAAEYVNRIGDYLFIANGEKKDTIEKILKGKGDGTLFLAQKKMRAKAKWITAELKDPVGVVIDHGALNALQNNKSLLLAGIKKIVGKFDKCDKINIYTDNGKVAGKGIVSVSSELIAKELSMQLNKKGLIVIHSDNLVVG